jgi:hypothetical protein
VSSEASARYSSTKCGYLANSLRLNRSRSANRHRRNIKRLTSRLLVLRTLQLRAINNCTYRIAACAAAFRSGNRMPSFKA